MFERPPPGEKAVLVHLAFPKTDYDADRREFIDLARSAGAEVKAVIGGRRQRPDAGLYIGTGKADEVAGAARAGGAELAVFNHDLSPSQERNLEKRIQCRVLDRTGLILHIFAQRARSHEGKLQVELAQLQHLSTRLVRGWTHLERQRGGGIGMTGPGETQLELDRRLIGRRIATLQKRLDLVRSRREQNRRARAKSQMSTVSLVGYTNAGKSTLLNRLTEAGVLAENRLFATLDPRTRRLQLPGGETVLVSDTVGFIRKLPHGLVEAFRSTLEEVAEADLLLHVVDASAPDPDAQIAAVHAVLDEIGARDIPELVVFNKADVAPPEAKALGGAHPGSVTISAATGDGVDGLLRALSDRLRALARVVELLVPFDRGDVVAAVHREGEVLVEAHEEAGTRIRARLGEAGASRFREFVVAS